MHYRGDFILADTITLTADCKDRLLFRRMRASEHLGRLFSFQVEILSQAVTVDLLTLLGTTMTVNFVSEGGGKRYYNGIVNAAEQTGFESIDDVRYATYAVTLVPKPWLLTQKVDCRIFTKTSVPDIVKLMLQEVGYADVDMNLSSVYEKRDYCVQYREDSFSFISRLMEQEGIYYYFTHSSGTHTMVLADSGGAHAAVAPFASLPYCPPTQRGNRTTATVSEWKTLRSVNPLKCELTDFDPTAPTATMLDTVSLEHDAGYHNIADLTVFDFPGDYTNATKSSTGQRYTQVRTQALNAQHQLFSGSSDAWGIATGNLFTLKDFPRSEYNQEYLLIGTEISLEGGEYASGGDSGPPFTCMLKAIASRQPYRSPQITPRPIIAGLQTAIVTGSQTDGDIVVDKNGCVQVTFHWNKPDKPNAKNSCPVRVASSWAGKSWGAINIPRVGQEVVISFLEGDPDQPLIIGSVYNAAHVPPYALPDNKTQSGIKSCSDPNGSASTFNELRFEDKKGSEDFYIHAQKDMHQVIEHDHNVTIKNDDVSAIQNNQKVTVSKDGSTSIGQKYKLEAGTEIEFVTGAASITMKSSGEIEIKGVNITISGDASVKVQSAATVEVAGDAMATVKAPTLTLKGEAMVQMSGGIIMIG